MTLNYSKPHFSSGLDVPQIGGEAHGGGELVRHSADQLQRERRAVSRK